MVPPDAACITGETSAHYYHGSLTTIDGFTFCRKTSCVVKTLTRLIIVREYGFDYVCGPTGFTLEYTGSPVFKPVRLWCE